MSNDNRAVIIWLDTHIGLPEYGQTIKKAFSSTLDPEWSHPTRLDDISIDNLIKADFSKDSYSYKNNAIEMYAFSDENACVQCFQENNHKRIFFIVSNALGEHFVPRIIKNYFKTFQKSVNDKCGSVYVFCLNIVNAAEWAIDYVDYVQIFDFETTLLARLTRDLGNYFVFLGEKDYGCKTLAAIRQALKYLYWAKTLFMRANDVQKSVASDSIIQHVEGQIAVAETLLQQITNGDDEISQSIAYGEFVRENDVEMHESNQQEKLNSSSSSFQSEVVKVESSLYLMEPDSAISSGYIEEKSLEPDDIKENNSEIGVFLLQPSPLTEEFEKIRAILKHLFGTNLIVVQEGQNYLTLLKTFALQLIVLLPSNDDDKLILEKLCSLRPPPMIYLLESQPDTTSEKEAFFTKYPSVCAMLKDLMELAVKVALDVALQSRTMGDHYSRTNDKDRANKMLDQNIELLNQLYDLAQKKVDNKDYCEEN